MQNWNIKESKTTTD